VAYGYSDLVGTADTSVQALVEPALVLAVAVPGAEEESAGCQVAAAESEASALKAQCPPGLFLDNLKTRPTALEALQLRSRQQVGQNSYL
jgi:hypothetical protein